MKGFTCFINYSLRFLFPIVIIWTILFTYINRNRIALFSYGLIFLIVTLGLILYIGMKREINSKILLIYIILVSLTLRVLWFLNIDSLPVSDFGMMFKGGYQFIHGELYIFQGTSYFARFPHMSLTVMYFGLIQKLFSDPINIARIINILFSMINVITLFLIGQQIFKDRNKSLWVMFIAGIYPPMIYYNNVFASENLAMPLFLLSVLFYLKAVEKKRIIGFVYSGLFLSIAHLFRPIGYVVLIAYIMYGCIYYQNDIKVKLRAGICLLLSAIMPFVLISIILIELGITQYPLWHGTEPISVSVLKGTNISSNGRWNAEDAALFGQLNDDYAKVDAESKRIIKERFKENPPSVWAKFFIIKYSAQWMEGDFGGAFWAEAGRTDETAQARFAHGAHSSNKMIISLDTQGFLFNQVIWISLLVLSYIGLYRKQTFKNLQINLLYILFCGFALFYLITESQARYAYIACWLFPILAASSFYIKKKA